MEAALSNALDPSASMACMARDMTRALGRDASSLPSRCEAFCAVDGGGNVSPGATGTFTTAACTPIAHCASGLTCTTDADQSCSTCDTGYTGSRCASCVAGWYDPGNGTCVADTTMPVDGTATMPTLTPGYTTMALTWVAASDAQTGVKEYRVCYATKSQSESTATPSAPSLAAPVDCTGGAGSVCYSTPATSYTLTGLTPHPHSSATFTGYYPSSVTGTYRSFRICAVDNAGNVSPGLSNATAAALSSRRTSRCNTVANCYDDLTCTNGTDQTCGLCRPGRTGADCATLHTYGHGWPLTNLQSFTDNGDGTVTQTATGLVWQKEIGKTTTSLDWHEAAVYCSRNEGGLPGSGWRLPSRRESLSLWRFSSTASNAVSGRPDGSVFATGSNYWFATGSMEAGDSGQPGLVKTDGSTTTSSMSLTFGVRTYVRCVRGGPTVVANRFTAGTSTVTDSVTNLGWQKVFPGSLTTPSGAASYCTSNTAALPGTGWRWPSALELSTLVDESDTANPLGTAFGSVSSREVWSSTIPATSSSGIPVTLSTSSGRLVGSSGSAYALCVRQGP